MDQWKAQEIGGYKRQMTDQELKSLKRAELLEMLIAQMEENEKLKAELAEAQKALDDRQIEINEAGSIAEAALQLNGVFDAAQAAAAQYLENIQQMNAAQESVCQRMEADARRRAQAICAEADAYSQEVRSKANAYWKQVNDRVRALLEDQEKLKALILRAMKDAPE